MAMVHLDDWLAGSAPGQDRGDLRYEVEAGVAVKSIASTVYRIISPLRFQIFQK
jgi:hypothetical protein